MSGEKDEFKRVNEHDMGTCKMVDDFEESYLATCKHNGVDPDNQEQLRRFIFNLFAMMLKSFEK